MEFAKLVLVRDHGSVQTHLVLSSEQRRNQTHGTLTTEVEVVPVTVVELTHSNYHVEPENLFKWHTDQSMQKFTILENTTALYNQNLSVTLTTQRDGCKGIQVFHTKS